MIINASAARQNFFRSTYGGQVFFQAGHRCLAHQPDEWRQVAERNCGACPLTY